MVELIIPQNLHFKILPLSVQEQEVTYIFQNTYFAKNVQNLHEGLPKGLLIVKAFLLSHFCLQHNYTKSYLRCKF